MSADQCNDVSMVQFRDYLNQRKSGMKTTYQERLARNLSRQQWNGCFQNNVVDVLAETYLDALAYLQSLPFSGGAADVDRGMSSLTRRLIPVFDGFVDEFLLFAVDKHRTSCALSNFPDEHKPSDDYVDAVKREVAEKWRDFALSANDFLLECR